MKKKKFTKKFPSNVKLKNLNYSSKSKNIYENLKLIFIFFKILKKENPDNLFTFTLKPNLYLGIINNLFKINFFPTITGLGTAKNKGGFLLKFVKIFMKLSFIPHLKYLFIILMKNFFKKNWHQ